MGNLVFTSHSHAWNVKFKKTTFILEWRVCDYLPIAIGEAENDSSSH